MGIEELKHELDRIAWLEQTDQEISERPNIGSKPSPDLINNQLSQLASSLDNNTLGVLELEEGYLIWSLRLALLVDPTYAKQRARLYVNSPNRHIQYWIQRILLET
jgi:hypothetical protein